MHAMRHICQEIQGAFLQFVEDDEVAYLLTDSRRLIFPDSTLFFALPGERRNGHQFLPDLYAAGVRNFVVYGNISCEPFPEANIIQVGDSIYALQALGAFHRRGFDLPVIGITGSNGKTIVKEWLNQLLGDEYNIVRSPRSFNSQIGVPLSVWQIDPRHELGIFEAGISRPGEMARLEAVIRPGIGVLTNIGAAHDEGFDSTAVKLEEKLQLFNRSDVLVFCSDQAAVRQQVEAWQKKHSGTVLFSWGAAAENRLRVTAVTKSENRTELSLLADDEPLSLSIGFTDEASIQNALSCLATMLALTGDPGDIQAKFDRLDPLAMRMELKTGINHCSIINDSYSSDMNSLKMAVDLLAQQAQHPRRTVILSDIPGIGRPAEELYADVAFLLKGAGVSRLIGIGPQIAAQTTVLSGSATEIVTYSSTDAFLADFPYLIFRDEAILLKGARVFAFEKIDRLLSLQAHETVLEISLDALVHNLKQYQQLLGATTRVMAMVKAFSYGTGSYEVARELEFHKVDYLGVAYVDEGVALRRAGIRLPVMIMNTEDESLDNLVEFRLEPVIYSFRILQALDKFCRAQAIRDLPVHIEIETGMNRLGFDVNEVPALIEKLAGSPFRILSVFSHLAASEEKAQNDFTSAQAEKFLMATAQLAAAVPYPFLKHLSNSAAIVRRPDLQFDMVRLGIGLYGLDPAGSDGPELRQVSTLRSTIAQIKSLGAGETVGYNRKGAPVGPVTIATVRLGYADGYPRSLGNGQGKMWLKERLVPTIGNICMDMTMVDITGVEGVREGDEIIVFGDALPVKDLAHWAGTIPYEILTGISQRVKRLYFE